MWQFCLCEGKGYTWHHQNAQLPKAWAIPFTRDNLYEIKEGRGGKYGIATVFVLPFVMRVLPVSLLRPKRGRKAFITEYHYCESPGVPKKEAVTLPLGKALNRPCSCSWIVDDSLSTSASQDWWVDQRFSLIQHVKQWRKFHQQKAEERVCAIFDIN